MVSKWKPGKAFKKFDEKFVKVNSCFSETDIIDLTQSMRNFYCSTLWQKGDILLVDNRKVMHAGMPGSGPRLIRALIANPLDMKYSRTQPGCFYCQDRPAQTIGYYMAEGIAKADK